MKARKKLGTVKNKGEDNTTLSVIMLGRKRDGPLSSLRKETSLTTLLRTQADSGDAKAMITGNMDLA